MTTKNQLNVFDFSQLKKTEEITRTVSISFQTNRTDLYPVWEVKGILRENFSFSASGNWKNVGEMLPEITPSGDITDWVALVTGDTTFQTSIASQKFYTGGGDISMSIPIRIMAEDNNNKIIDPRAAFILLVSGVSPTSSLDLLESLSQAGGTIWATMKSFGNTLVDTATGEETFPNALLKNIKELGEYVAKNGRNFSINIGGYFNYHNMIIKDVQGTFSKELTTIGGTVCPLYVDVSLTVESGRNLTGVEMGNALGSAIKITID